MYLVMHLTKDGHPPPHFKDGKTEAGEAKSFMQVEIALVSLGHGSTEAGWAAPA